jgi:phosphate transport system permease protein
MVTIFASIPLFCVVWMLLWRGGQRLTLLCFTQLRPSSLEQGGGFGNAIVATLIIVALATAFSVPVGILCAVFLAQTGFPSILAGAFAYGAIVLTTGGYSPIAGAS